jgi:hypothetical protein
MDLILGGTEYGRVHTSAKQSPSAVLCQQQTAAKAHLEATTKVLHWQPWGQKLQVIGVLPLMLNYLSSFLPEN